MPIFKICLVCGRTFKRKPYEIITAKYCSSKCRIKGTRKYNLPSGVSKTHHGYLIVKINGIIKYQHRVLMEKHIGRKLFKNEVVHHKNGDTSDNRIENLELFSDNSEHRKSHDMPRDIYGRFA